MVKLHKNWEPNANQDMADGVLIAWHGALVDSVTVTGSPLSISGVINCIVEHPLTKSVTVYSNKTGKQIMHTSVCIVEEQ